MPSLWYVISRALLSPLLPTFCQRLPSIHHGSALLRSLLHRFPSSQPHLLSLQQPGSSAWLSTAPTRPELVLANEDFRLAVRLRLRLLPNFPPLSTCNCGSPLFPDLFLSC